MRTFCSLINTLHLPLSLEELYINIIYTFGQLNTVTCEQQSATLSTECASIILLLVHTVQQNLGHELLKLHPLLINHGFMDSWILCALNFALLRSAIRCIRGPRSASHKADKSFSLSSPIKLAAKEGRIPCC